MPTDAVWALEIVPHDQSNDPYARTLQQVLHDLGSHPAITHGRLYLFQGSHSPQLEQAARKLCLDPIVADARVNLELESVGIPEESQRPDRLVGTGLSRSCHTLG